MNYFELFGLPVAPSVDRSLLARKYFLLQKESHPDFFIQGSEDEKEEALQQSAHINRAFNIFQQEEKTIEYFLELTGMIKAGEKYNLPPDFLMEMMEINEALADADGEIIKKRVQDYEADLNASIKPILKSYRADATTGALLLQLKEYYYKKKYLNRILERFAD